MKKVEEGKKKVISVKVASNGNYNLYFEGKKISVKKAKEIVYDYERCCRATSDYWFVDYDLYIDVKVASQLVIGDDYSKFVLFDGEIENVMEAVKTGACGQHIEFVPAKAENTDVEDDGSNDEPEEDFFATIGFLADDDSDEDDELIYEPEIKTNSAKYLASVTLNGERSEVAFDSHAEARQFAKKAMKGNTFEYATIMIPSPLGYKVYHVCKSTETTDTAVANFTAES